MLKNAKRLRWRSNWPKTSGFFLPVVVHTLAGPNPIVHTVTVPRVDSNFVQFPLLTLACLKWLWKQGMDLMATQRNANRMDSMRINTSHKPD